jgi:hypothetical protein
MHELGITPNIIAIVGEAAKGQSDACAARGGEVAGRLRSASKPLRGGRSLMVRRLIFARLPALHAASTVVASLRLRRCVRPAPLLKGEELNIKTMELEEAA